MIITRNGSDRIYESMLIMFSLIFLVTSLMQMNGVNSQQVPCFFIFGDSLADSGNNNFLPTLAKVNYRPYGVDFPNRVPTGRFTNGLNTVDFIGKYLGFSDFIPPIYAAIGNSILKGVNYASGGAGIRDETGFQLGQVLSMNEQLDHHQLTVLKINAIKGSREIAKDYLKKCIYHVGIGNNDYLNNYFVPLLYPSSSIFTTQQYAQVLIDQLSGQITRLYGMGGRKVALAALGLIGCTPYAIKTLSSERNVTTGCVERLNDAIHIFNAKLFDLVNELNSKYSDAKFIYLNSTGMVPSDPSSLGLTVLDAPCCSVNILSGTCNIESKPCENRSTYAFWDDYHPTEFLNQIFAIRSYSASLPTDSHPIDIKQLAQLQL